MFASGYFSRSLGMSSNCCFTWLPGVIGATAHSIFIKGWFALSLWVLLFLYWHRFPQLPFGMLELVNWTELELEKKKKKHHCANHFSIFGLFSSTNTVSKHLLNKIHLLEGKLLVYRKYNIRICVELRAPLENCCEGYAWNSWKKCQWDKNYVFSSMFSETSYNLTQFCLTQNWIMYSQGNEKQWCFVSQKGVYLLTYKIDKYVHGHGI